MRAFLVSVGTTVVGTVLSVLLMMLYAYPLSRQDFPYKKFFTFLVLITMVFHGGMAPKYITYSSLLNLRNSYIAIILPLIANGFYIFMIRTFFKSSIPAELIEAAKIDGAGEIRIFRQIVIPLSLPVIGTMGLFMTLRYWNEWVNYMLNHLHFLYAGRHPDHRPFFFSRWCGLGGHRYPLGFSGDAQVTWSMLDFEPYFTATAANVGNFFWSHDIGGHYSGVHDPELYVRWVQFGVLSPILRLHSCKNPLQQRLPWMFDFPYSEALMQSLRLRRQMIPYLYTMAFLAHTEAAPLIAPMYYENPECDEAYTCPNQYWFGNQLIAAPVTAPADPVMGTSRKLVWLPQGNFYDFQTGEAYRGGRYIAVYADLQSVPLLARSGAVIPLDDDGTSMGCELPETVEWHIFPGEGSFTLFEDDGISQQFRQGRYAETVVTNRTGEYEGRLSLEVRGDGSVIPPHRRHRFRIKSVGKPDHVTVVSNGLPIPFSVSYDEEALQLTVEVLPASPSDTLEILLTAPDGLALRADFSEKRLRHQITRWKARNDDVWAVISHMEELAADPSRLPSIASQMPFSQMLCVWETLTGSAFCGPDGTSAVPSV